MEKVTPSIFTEIVVEGIASGEADTDLDGNITFDDLHAYVVEQLRARNSRQNPQKWYFGLTGDIVLAANPNPHVRALAEDLRARVESEDARVRLGAVIDLDALARRSDGRRAQAATRALEALTKDDSRAVSAAAKAALADVLDHNQEGVGPTQATPSGENKNNDVQATPEAEKPFAETPKVVHLLPPQLSKPERVEALPPSSGATGGKTPSKQVIAFLAIAAVLVVAGLIYLAARVSHSPLPQPAPVVASSPPSENDWLAGKRYMDTNNFAEALPLLLRSANAGNQDAMNSLGDVYYDGRGVAQDDTKAREWYQKAADAGNGDAMFNLGWLYEKGRGVTRDPTKARDWYQKAADAGNIRGKGALARLDSN